MIIRHGDCIAEMSAMLDEGVRVDAVVTDPPYELGFMGKGWDSTGIANRMETWLLALELLKPGGMLLSFGGSRTYHRMACAVEDAGFEIRDCIMWLYGSGMPKSKSLLKPACEPIIMARKPGPLAPLNIDACRVGIAADDDIHTKNPHTVNQATNEIYGKFTPGSEYKVPQGRWPANVLLEEGCVDEPWARYFYSAKASKHDRAGSKHCTVKPISLMRYLCRLVTPPGGLILDPFAGSGTTLEAAALEGFRCIGIEQSAEYVADIRRRMERTRADLGLFAAE